MIKTKILIKKFLKNNFENFYEIVRIFIFNIILRRKKDYTFQGWGLKTNTSLPWMEDVRNLTSKQFIENVKILDKKIKDKEFYLAQISNYYENLTFEDVFKHYKSLSYRNYVIHYSSLLAFNNTKSRNIVECGSAEGLSTFFCIKNYNRDKDFKAYLYDSWEKMREKELTNNEDLSRLGNYDYLNIDMIKKNLKEFEKNIIYNKGFIPEIFNSSKSENPKELSWLHIDLNSAFPTIEALEFFYPKIENKGIILLDDYGHAGYSETRAAAELFFENKNVDFLQFMTGQAMITKKS